MGIWPVDRGAPAMLEMIGPLASGRGPYLDYFQTVDPHVAVVAARHGGWTFNAHHFDEGYVRRSEYYNDFLLVHGVRYGAATLLKNSLRELRFCLSVNRGGDEPPYTEAELGELERLTPSLERAILLHEKLARSQAEGHRSANLMEQLSFGVVVVDAATRVVTMNQQAKAILDAADGLHLEDGILVAARSFERTKLAQLLARCAKQPRACSGELLIGRPSKRLPYALLVTPLPFELNALVGTGSPAMMIIISDFDSRALIRAERLMELFGFTSAEARLAVAIAQGKDLRQIAAESRKALSTLRSQLASLFDKSGVKRQVDVARIVLSLPAIRD